MNPPRTIYTRTYSSGGAGQLASARGPQGDPLSDTDLCKEFRRHADPENREPTALVSVSDRIIDTVKRAIAKHVKDGEPPEDIWIVFIEVPATTTHGIPTGIHNAQKLAEKYGHKEPGSLHHEVIFEWAVPEEFVLHKVCLSTLMARGLHWEKYLIEDRPEEAKPQLLKTRKLRSHIGKDLLSADPWEIGIEMSSFARKFGARAPLDWIAYELLYDCLRPKIVDDDVVRLSYEHGHSVIVDFVFFCEVERGIEIGLNEWWLLQPGFLWDYKEFEEWRDAKLMEISAEENMLHDEAVDELEAKHEQIYADIEAEAIRIGL